MTITKNNEQLKKLIADYKNYIAKSKMEDEVYKWKLLKEFKGHPDTNAEDFKAEIHSIKFQNLIYAIALAVTRHIAKDRPEEFRQCFIDLFDESKILSERLEQFNRESLKTYRSLGETLSHHQDERTMAAYLTFNNPDKYTFYKSSFYKPFCELMDEKPAGKFQKYGHYLELLNVFIHEFIEKDKDLINQVKSYIPEYYDGSNHLLLAQDILFTMLDQKRNSPECSYWIFQGNPKIYDIKAALNAESVKSWSVKTHKEAIKPGDKFILWYTGDYSGVYALGEITSEPIKRIEEPDELTYYKIQSENKFATRVTVRITHNMAEHPITREQIEGVKELENLKVGTQGTNFSATKEEYNTILQMIEPGNSQVKYWIYAPGENASKWDEFYTEGIMALGWDQLGDLNQYKIKEQIAQALRSIDDSEGSKKNDSLANYEFKNVISIGDVIIVKRGLHEFLGYGIVTSDYYFDDNRLEYKSCRKVDWKKNGVWTDSENKTVLKTLTNISQYKDYIERLKLLIGIDGSINQINPLKKEEPVNKILYGPPGTGKTFTLKSNYFPNYVTKESNLTKEQHFENVIRELTWWQVIAAALIQTGKTKVGNLLNHPWILQKAKISASNTVRPTLWGQLQSHTIDSCEFVNVKAKQQPFIFNKTEDSHWEIIEEEVKEQYPEIYDIINSVENFNPSPDKEIKRYVFTTFHQSFNYEDFIEGIKPVLSDENENGEVAYRIEDGIFKSLCKRAESDPENRYAIFIDEINRGNVSNIFGELITLIETDKRKGAEHAMSASLPYSKKQFSVPSNVDIYGTMNTADRSVEALDTALRRRFSFLEMLPQPELIQTVGPLKSTNGILNGIDLTLLLKTINERIEKLIDKDHQIGHSYFLKVDSLESLKSAFHNAIIPLLQEYFFGDYGKIGLVLGQGFFEELESSEDEKFFAEFKEYEIDGILDKRVYHIKDLTQLDDNTFIEIVKAILPRS